MSGSAVSVTPTVTQTPSQDAELHERLGCVGYSYRNGLPCVQVITSEIDQGLGADYRVVPGVGEFGDRYFGTE